MRAMQSVIVSLPLLCPVHCNAVDANLIGKPLPSATEQQAPSAFPDFDNATLDGVGGKTAAKILATPAGGGASLNVRGKQDVEMYRYASSSVVYVENNAGLGSGTYIAPNLILTNAHVVGKSRAVAVVFKPLQEGSEIKPSDVIIGKVLRTDRLRDLALLSVESAPAHVHPLPLGADSDIQIGADVHAIGHPKGQIWTYTKGIISQFRKNYQWQDEEGAHRADVIQTQTPISPGNSGGPLISEGGKLIGVNSFKSVEPGYEGLNYAVSVDDVAGFIRSGTNDRNNERSASACKPVKLFEGRNRKNDAKIVLIDSNCDGKVDASIVTPDDPKQPISALVDSNHDGKTDIIVEDRDRDGRWDISFYDVNFDEIIDLVGFHPDGKILPSKFERYDPKRAY